jgi:hypothetical protein
VTIAGINWSFFTWVSKNGLFGADPFVVFIDGQSDSHKFFRKNGHFSLIAGSESDRTLAYAQKLASKKLNT